jgi:UDP-N-acetylglucosamine 1-carboxyvinyltransferase
LTVTTTTSARAAEVIAVRPGPPLAGTVTVDGSKNAALPILGAAAALGRPVRLGNIPASTDVHIMLALLQQAGWHVAQPVGEQSTAVILPTENRPSHPELAQAAQSSGAAEPPHGAEAYRRMPPGGAKPSVCG